MTTAKTKRLLTFILALVMCTALFSVTNVGAKKVNVSSSLFTKIDNVTFTSTEEGLALSSSNKANSSATFANNLYMGDFSFVFQIVEPNFESLSFKFTSEVNEESVFGLINITENVLVFTKKDGNLNVSLNNGDAKNTGIDFQGKIKLTFDGNKFKVMAASGTSGTDFEVTSKFARNEATFAFSFNNIVSGKAAKFIIEEINGQNFKADSAQYIDDNKAPLLRLNKEKTFNDIAKQIVYAPVNMQYTLPAYGLDVISTSFTYEMKVDFGGSKDENDLSKVTEWSPVVKDDIKSLKVSLKEEGWYRITEVKVKDGNDNSANAFLSSDVAVSEEKPIYIYAEKWDETKIPVIDYSIYREYSSFILCTKTNKFQFPMPTITSSSAPLKAQNNSNMFDYVVKYKEPNSSSVTWLESKGLVFEAKKTGGEYLFWIEVTDKLGNKSAQPDLKDIIKIEFKDEIPPQITISNFPTEKYVDQSLTLPSPTVIDSMDSSPTREIKVYYVKDADGNLVYETDENGDIVYETDENDEFIKDENDEKIKKKIVVSTNYSFTPEKKGTYEVIYSAKDKAGNATTLDTISFVVIDAPPAPSKPFIDTTNPWTVILLCIAGASALGIVALMFVKPKED